MDQNVKLLDSKSITIAVHKDMHIILNKKFKNLMESVNVMSDKFDSFGKQIQELIIKSISVISLIIHKNCSWREH